MTVGVGDGLGESDLVLFETVVLGDVREWLRAYGFDLDGVAAGQLLDVLRLHFGWLRGELFL